MNSKLIRDNVPGILTDNKSECHYAQIKDDALFAAFLRAKMFEDAQELASAPDQGKQLDGFADLYTTLEAYAELFGITREQIDEVKADKATKQGGYRDRLLAFYDDPQQENTNQSK